MQPARGPFATGITDLRLIALALLAGCAGLHLLPELPPWRIYLVLLGVAVVLWPLRWLLLAALLGAAWSQFQAEARLAERLPLAEHNQERWLTGKVVSLPEQGASKVSFVFAPVDGGPARIRVSWHESAQPVAAGDCLRLLLRLRVPRGLANPGSFDFEGWLFRERIGATAQVRRSKPCHEGAIPAAPVPVADWLLALRQHIVQGVGAALPQQPMRGVILGLTVGDASAISDAQWQALRRTGGTHLISISGLHIALVAAVVFFAARRLWMLFPRLCLYLPAPKAGVIGAALIAIVYSALAGFSIPTQRSLLMLLVVLGAVAWGRSTAPSRVLALALIAVLLWEPGAVLYPGFWLSFLAVAWIAYLLTARVARPGRWQLWVWLQIALSLALAPAALFGFGETSLVGPFANLILIPLFSVVIPVLLLNLLLWAALPGWGAGALNWNAIALDWIWRGVDWAAGLPYAYWTLAQPSLWITLAASLGMLWLLAPRGWPARYAGALLCLPLLLPPAAPAAGVLQFTLLDVGQGLAAVLRTRTHVLLYDTGPGGELALDAGEAVVAPYLRSRGIRRLDALVLSHGDLDHSGGLSAVRRQFPIVQEIGTDEGMPCERGQSWDWDGVQFEMLHPEADALWRDNNASCVLKVTAGEHALLLTGDIERGAEFSLVLAETTRLPAEVLVVPHHGSATSSTDTLIDTVRPRLALAPAGWRNRFRHPHPRVLERFGERRIPVLISGETGAMNLELRPGHKLTRPKLWREQSRRIWRYPPNR